jgi:hypothetical protein
MPPLSRSELRQLCQTAEPGDLLGFVADLYAARGWTVVTTNAGDAVVTLERGESQQRLGIATETTSLSGVDTIVIIGTKVDPATVTADTILDIGDLWNLLLYSVDRERAATIFERWFDQELSDPVDTVDLAESHTDSQTDGLQDFTPESEPDTPRDTTTRAITDAAGQSQPPTANGSGDTSTPFRTRRHVGVVVGLLLVLGIVIVATGVGLSVADQAVNNDTTTDTGVTPVPTTETLATATQETPESGQLASTQPTQIPARATGFPPGVDRTGITDYRQLIDAHESELEGQSYRITLSYREIRNKRLTGARTQTVRVENGTTYHATSTEFGRLVSPSPSLVGGEVYANGSVEFERTSTGVTRRRVQNPTSHRTALSRYLGWYLSVNESQAVAASTDRGMTTVRVSTDGDPYPGVTNATGTVIVTESGLVTHLYRTHSTPNSPVRVAITIRVSDVGTTTVSAPEWTTE